MTENEIKLDKLSENNKCLPCKYTAVSTLFIIGTYLMNIGKKQKKLSIISAGIGSVLLGVGEIFDLSPFR